MVKNAKQHYSSALKAMQTYRFNNGLEYYLDTNISIIGTETTYGKNRNNADPREVLLRIVATHIQKDALK